MKFSLTIKLWFIFLLLNIVTLTFLGTYSFFQAKKAIIERTFDQLTSVRIEKKTRIERFFNDRKKEIDFFLANFYFNKNTLLKSLGNEDPTIIIDAFEPDIFQFLTNRKYYSTVYIIFNESIVFQFDSLYRKDKVFFQKQTIEILSHKFIHLNRDINKAIMLELTGTDSTQTIPAIFIADKIHFNGKTDILFLFQINHDAINSIMFENNIYNGLGKTGETYLVGDDYLMRSASRFKTNSIYKTEVKTEGVIKAFESNSGIEIIKDYRNISVLSSFSKVEIDDLNWVILAEIDTNEAMLPIFTIRNSILYLSIIITLLLIGVIALLSQLITLPIKRLKEATNKISEGNYNALINPVSRDEIGQLTDTFNSMVLKIKEQTDKLKLERSMRLKSMLEGQEKERQRLSRELHDGLGQLILAMKLKLQQTVDAPKEKVEKLTQEVITYFDKAIKEVRDISNNLMPAELKEFGFAKALNGLLKEIEKSSKITISIDFHDHIKIENIEHQTYLYRIFQEALSNIMKHANASKIHIQIHQIDDNIHVLIRDNGKGFEANLSQKGNGINNMKERVNLLNGSFHIDSNAHGTEIQIKIPYNNFQK